MVLVLHICVALMSMITATVGFFRPSRAGLRFTSGLLAITLATGTYMVATSPVHILQTCLSGLFYVGFIGVFLFAASRRLAKLELLSRK